MTKRGILDCARLIEIKCNAILISKYGTGGLPGVDENVVVMRNLKRRLTIPYAKWFPVFLAVDEEQFNPLVADLNDFLNNEQGGAVFSFRHATGFLLVGLLHSDNTATAFHVRFSEFAVTTEET